MAEVVRDLKKRYGDLGSVLVKHDGRFLVVSSTVTPIGPETKAFPATRTGKVTSWREVMGGYGLTIAQVVADLDNFCHCGAPMRGSDHCPFCGCEQFEAFCGERYGPDEREARS